MGLKLVLPSQAWTRGPSTPTQPHPEQRTRLYLLDDPIPPKACDKLGWGCNSKVSVQVQFLVLPAPLHQVESRHARSAEGKDRVMGEEG
jgi:hypothetical protein